MLMDEHAGSELLIFACLRSFGASHQLDPAGSELIFLRKDDPYTIRYSTQTRLPPAGPGGFRYMKREQLWQTPRECGFLP